MRWLYLACALCTALACGEDPESNTLGGSVDRVYPLSFTDTRARATARELAIQYVDVALVPVQVVIDLESDTFSGAGTYDLVEIGQVVGSRDGTELPAFLEGELTLSAYGETQGSSIRGEFTARVGDEETSYAVFGTFDTSLERLD